MKEPDKLIELMNNPYTLDMLRSASEENGLAVMRIISSCELLEDAAGKNISRRSKKYIETIRAMCRSILRNSAVNSAMAADGDRVTLLRIDRFAESVAAGCKHVLGDKLKIVINENSGAMVMTDPDVLRFFILGTVRRIITASEGGRISIEMGTSCEDGCVRLSMRQIKDAPAPEQSYYRPESFFDRNYRDICKAVSDRLDITIDAGKEGFVITMPEAKADPAEMRMPFVYGDPGDFSYYRIMLDDTELDAD